MLHPRLKEGLNRTARWSIRHTRYMSHRSTMDEIFKHNATLYASSNSKPTFAKTNDKKHPDAPSLTETFTSNTTLESDLSDLSSVASMNTILGILENAQNSNPRHVTHPGIPAQTFHDTTDEAGPTGGATYLDNFFKLHLALVVDTVDGPKANRSAILKVQSAYRSQRSHALGRNVLEYIIIRYLNDQGVSERGSQGDFNGLATYESTLAQVGEKFVDTATPSRYKSDGALTMNGSLDVYQAIAMHFVKRPSIAVKWIYQEIDQLVTLDFKLDSAIKNPATESFVQNFDFKHQLITPGLRKRKSENPALITPIYNQYDVSPLRHRGYLVHLPFIVNDYEVISRILKEKEPHHINLLQGVLTSQSLEGSKLFQCIVELRLLKTKTSSIGLTDARIRAGITTKSHLLSKVNIYSRGIHKSFSHRLFQESKAITLLEQQFNIYLAVWYRLSLQDTSKWCFELTDHYADDPLTPAELDELEAECIDYFKLQLRSNKTHKLILEEQKLIDFSRSYLRLPTQVSTS